ncbi:MAG: hypothetical protein M1833_001275 [Piccolia ochrophora]|nr:MAG: hypothetical protein M1833_001275 [Piccolia ochrophora]
MENELEDARGVTDIIAIPVRAAVSKFARRVYISTILLGIAALVLLALAPVAYILFYINYIPQLGFERVVHLQFGDRPHPTGTISLPAPLLHRSQPYDVSISVLLPRSPTNLAAGNFMLSLALSSTTTSSFTPAPLVTARKPAILTYASPMVDTVQRAVSLPWYVLGWRREEERVEVRMLEGWSFGGKRDRPGSLTVGVEAPGMMIGSGVEDEISQTMGPKDALMIYEALVRFEARFTGLRYIMYTYRTPTFLIFTTFFYTTSLLSTIAIWFLLATYHTHTSPTNTRQNQPRLTTPSSSHTPTSGSPTLSPTVRTFPSSSGLSSASRAAGPALRYQPPQQAYPTPEPEDGRGAGRPVGASVAEAEADDEDDDEDDLVDAGLAPWEMEGGGGARRMDSGLGTSLEEGEAAGARRRRKSGGGVAR